MKQGGRWTEAEHQLFLEGLDLFGRDWRQIEEHIGGSRTCSQIRSHAQKYFLRKDKFTCKKSESLPTPTPSQKTQLPEQPLQNVSNPQSLLRNLDDASLSHSQRSQLLKHEIQRMRTERDKHCRRYLNYD